MKPFCIKQYSSRGDTYEFKSRTNHREWDRDCPSVSETLFGILLIAGFKIRMASVLSGLLLLSFAIGMAIGRGIKTPFVMAMGGGGIGGTCASIMSGIVIDSRSRNNLFIFQLSISSGMAHGHCRKFPIRPI